MPTTLPISPIVDVSVSLTASSTVRIGFNIGLIIGSTTIISPATRIKEYTSVNAVLADGFTTASDEYKAALLYFSQSPAPKKLYIGRWDKTGAETAVQAVTACRSANSEWYAFTVIGATKSEILAIAAYVETATPSTVHFFTTADADVLAGTVGNVIESVNSLGYKRSHGEYSVDGLYAVSGIMGVAMGLNTGTANSASTLAYKKIVGRNTVSLTEAQVNYILGKKGNVFINRGNTYNVYQQGTMADGTSFDSILGRDMLVNDLQQAVMDLLTGVNKIPQTDDGVARIVNSLSKACDKARGIGFIESGIWTSGTLTDNKGNAIIENGSAIPTGYIVYAESIANQSVADRQARKSPPIYIAIKEAGAIEFVNITVIVNL